MFLLPITTPEVVTKPLPYTKDQCLIVVDCAHHLWIWEMCSRHDKWTHYLAPVNHAKSAHPPVCFGLSWSGGYTYDDVMSIYRDMVFPTHMYCTTAKNIADMQSFEEAMAWGAVTFVKYWDKYVPNYRKYRPESILILPLHKIHGQVSRWSNFFLGGHSYLS